MFRPEVGVVDPGERPGWPPNLPLKNGPDRTSHSKVIEFTVNDFFGKSGAIHRLFPNLLFLTDPMTKAKVLHRFTLGVFGCGFVI